MNNLQRKAALADNLQHPSELEQPPIEDAGGAGVLEAKPEVKPWVWRTYNSTPGARIKMRDGSHYPVTKTGSIVSTDPKIPSKKVRNRAKREARKSA